MELSIVVVIFVVIFEVQSRGWYQQQPRRRYSLPLRPLQNTQSYSTESFDHHIPYKYYGYQPYQIFKIYRTESFDHHNHQYSQELLPTPINSFDLNEHPINGQYICQVCYKCHEDSSSEESYEDTWSRPNVVVLYRHNNRIYKVGKEKSCPYTYDLCCCKISTPPATPFQPRPLRPSWSPIIPNTNIFPQPWPKGPGLISPQPQLPRPSYIPPKTPQWKPSPQPQTPMPSKIYPQTPFWKPSLQPPSSSYLPPKIPAMYPSLHPEPPRPSQIFPSSNVNCTCIPFFTCDDEETSSNLTGSVNDRKHIPDRQESCPNPTDVCCYNPVKPSSVPTRNPSPQPRPPIPSQIFPSLNVNCTCTPFFRCYDEETSSNLTGAVDDRNHISERQEICSDPNDVCCFNSVTSSEPQTMSPPVPYEPQGPPSCTCTPFFRCYDEETSSNLTDVVDDRNQESCPESNDVCCYNLVPSPQGPPQTSPPINDCTCTSFFICYDEETSSNLTGTVDDRNHIQTGQESCPNANDVCCYNLVEPSSNILAKSMSSQHNPLSSSSFEVSKKPIDQNYGSSVWEPFI